MKEWHYRAYTPELMDTLACHNPEQKIIDAIDGNSLFDEDGWSDTEELHKALHSLPSNEKEIVWEYFFDGKTFQQIADKRKISRQYAHQIYQKSISKLYKMLKKEI